MDFEEYSRKRAVLEKGIKRVQFRFVIIPVVLGVAIANIFVAVTLEHMVGIALVVGVVLGLPLQLFISKKIDITVREIGFKCTSCDKSFPVRKLGEIANTGKCPACDHKVIN